MEYYKNRVDFNRYHRDGTIFKEERKQAKEFKLKKVLSLGIDYKLKLMEQLTRDIEFLMTSQIYEYKVTLSYYELNEGVRQMRQQQDSQQDSQQESRRKSSTLPSLKQPLLGQSNFLNSQALKVARQGNSHPNYYETVYGNYYLEISISNYLQMKENVSDFEKEKEKVQQYSTCLYKKIKNEL